MRISACTRMKFRVPLAVLLIASGIQGNLHPQEPGKGEDLKVRQTTDRISNQQAPMGQRLADYSELLKLEPHKRDQGLRALVSGPDESIAAMAAAALIRDGSPETVDLVVPRISKWSSDNQSVVLEAIRFVDKEEPYWDIPRTLLRNMSSAPGGIQHANSHSPLDSAAMILSASNETSDRSLLRDALLAQPVSRGLWLAAARRELTSREAALAASTWKNQELSLEVRVAAATAIAAEDHEAAAFAVGEIKAFLSRFGRRELGETLNAARFDPQEKKDLYYMREHLVLLAALRFLKTADAETLTFDFLSSRNEEIRETLGLVAAARWPKHLLTAGQSSFDKGEYENLLTYLTVLHPDLKASILAKIAQPRLDEILVRLGKVGVVGVFGLPATIALG